MNILDLILELLKIARNQVKKTLYGTTSCIDHFYLPISARAKVGNNIQLYEIITKLERAIQW